MRTFNLPTIFRSGPGLGILATLAWCTAPAHAGEADAVVDLGHLVQGVRRVLGADQDAPRNEYQTYRRSLARTNWRRDKHLSLWEQLDPRQEPVL